MNLIIKKYFNPYLDLRAIGAFRILMAIVLILDLLINKWPYLEAFYTEQGVLDHSVLNAIINANPSSSLYQFGLLYYIDDYFGVTIFFVLTFIVYVCLGIGYRSKLMSILAFGLLWSIHQRNPIVLSGPDEILINFLFISLFLPLGSRYSLFRSRDYITQNRYLSFGTFYALFFIGMVYFYQAFLKSGHLWENGEALAFALQETIWTKSTASYLLSFPELCAVLSDMAKWIEYAIFPLLFLPLMNKWSRFSSGILLLILHWTIFVFLDLGLFPIIVPMFVVLLFPSEFFDKLEAFFKKRKRTFEPLTLNRFRFIDSKKVRLISNAFLIGIFVIINWKASLTIPSMNKSLPEMSFMKKINHSSLFYQYWGFYCPNPSITHGWYKVVGINDRGEKIDLKNGKPLSLDDSDLDHYRSYSWLVLYYKTILYGQVNSRSLLNKWAEFEYEQAIINNAHENIVQVQIMDFRQTIISPTEVTGIQNAIISYSPKI